MLKFFSVIEDPRSHINKKHELPEIIILIVLGVIGGCDSWVEIELFGKTKLDFLRTFLSLKNGIPSHDTIGRVISLIDPKVIQEQFIKWVLRNKSNPEFQHIAIDGKTLRATSSTHGKFDNYGVVSAYSSDAGLCLGYEKGNLKEEKANFESLINLLNLNKVIVTMDANGLTASILNAIVDKKGDFIVAVKSPNGVLKNYVKQSTSKEDVEIFEEEERKSHGRIEKRTCIVGSFTKSFNDNLNDKRIQERRVGIYPKFNSCMKVISERSCNGIKSVEERFFISSLKAPSAKFSCELIRSHWSVENSLHWALDVTFNEDRCTVKDKKAAYNFAALRRFVLNLFQKETTRKISIRGKRKMASWDDNYLLKVASGASFE